jgi:hypothetical protein
MKICEGNDVEQITKYQKMMLELQKEIAVLQSVIDINEQEWTFEDEEEKRRDKTFKGKLDKNLPKFGGNLTDNYDDWIFLLDSYQKFNKIKNEQMMGLILPLVRGQALQILKRMLL